MDPIANNIIGEVCLKYFFNPCNAKNNTSFKPFKIMSTLFTNKQADKIRRHNWLLMNILHVRSI